MSVDMNNDNFEQRQEVLREISETINTMQKPLRQIVESVSAASQALVATIQSDAVQNVLQFGQKIAQTFATYDFSSSLSPVVATTTGTLAFTA